MTVEGENGTNGTLAKNRAHMDRFLQRLRESGNIRASCEAAGIPRQTVYNWRKRWKTFSDEWDDALEDAVDLLEKTAWDISLKERSERMIQFLLKAHRPDKYSERVKQEISGPDGEPILIKLDK